MTKNEQMQADVAALLKARLTFLWINTREEHRIEAALLDPCGKARYAPLFWSVASGLVDASWKKLAEDRSLEVPSNLLAYIESTKDRCAYILRDGHVILRDFVVQRGFIDLARKLQAAPLAEARAIIVLSPSSEVPLELRGHVTVVEWPLPEREDISAVLDDITEVLDPDMREKAVAPDQRDSIVDAATGLLIKDAADFFAKSLVSEKRVDPSLVVAEKKRLIAATPGVEWFPPDPRGLAAIGGNDQLVAWVLERKLALSLQAREFGLPAPKGVFLAGVSGCGKSLTAKVVPTVWGLPLLRFDLGGFKSKYVGESEGQIRGAFRLAEAMAPVVVWFDEIEKSLAGASGPQGDGGVASDALGAILQWMQECVKTVFVIATANEVRGLPPEFLRKGRFDEVFFVDLPNARERAQILAVTLRKFNRDAESIALDTVAAQTEGFTGAEIAALVPDALFACFREGQRALRTDDIVDVARKVVPLSKTAGDKLEELRTWAKGRARPASTPETKTVERGRKLDM